MVVRAFLVCNALVVLFSLFGTTPAYAKFYVNSICTMKASRVDRAISGDKNLSEKFPLASISKVVTSLWALEVLGPEYRFSTKLHITKVSQNSYDVHIEGSRDPIFGRNASYFIISELNNPNLAIRNIERLSFDENFLIDWHAEEHPRVAGTTPFYETSQKQVQAVIETLRDRFITPVSITEYRELKRKAARIGISMDARPAINVRQIDFKLKKSFAPSSNTVTLEYRSAPLKTILKRMNNQSNNYIADNLYWNLGGTTAFNRFVTNSLKLSTNEIEFYLGSGNNADYLYNTNQPIYNKASCETMIKVLFRMDELLKQSGHDLSDVMAVAGVDSSSTVASYHGNFEDSTIAKTGSVNKAKTLAGTISTKNGTIYFAVLMHTDGRADWGAANAIIRSKVNEMIVNNGGPQRLNYDEIVALPFDRDSKLRILNQNRLN